MADEIPIHALAPATTPPLDKAIRAVVTLAWPYSASTQQSAILLAARDFRLRSRRGQVRVRFTNASAAAVARAGVSIGDEVVLRLAGAVWEADAEAARTPGRSVEGELMFRHRLSLRIVRAGGEVAIEVDEPVDSRRQSTGADGRAPATPTARSTRPVFSPSEAMRDESWTFESPAFARKLQPTGDGIFSSSSFEGPLDDERPVKRQRLSYGGVRWRQEEEAASPERSSAVEKDSEDYQERVAGALPQSSQSDSGMEQDGLTPTRRPLVPLEESATEDRARDDATLPPARPAQFPEMHAASSGQAEIDSGLPRTGTVTPDPGPLGSADLPLPSSFLPDVAEKSLRSTLHTSTGASPSEYTQSIARSVSSSFPTPADAPVAQPQCSFSDELTGSQNDHPAGLERFDDGPSRGGPAEADLDQAGAGRMYQVANTTVDHTSPMENRHDDLVSLNESHPDSESIGSDTHQSIGAIFEDEADEIIESSEVGDAPDAADDADPVDQMDEEDIGNEPETEAPDDEADDEGLDQPHALNAPQRAQPDHKRSPSPITFDLDTTDQRAQADASSDMGRNAEVDIVLEPTTPINKASPTANSLVESHDQPSLPSSLQGTPQSAKEKRMAEAINSLFGFSRPLEAPDLAAQPPEKPMSEDRLAELDAEVAQNQAVDHLDTRPSKPDEINVAEGSQTVDTASELLHQGVPVATPFTENPASMPAGQSLATQIDVVDLLSSSEDESEDGSRAATARSIEQHPSPRQEMASAHSGLDDITPLQSSTPDSPFQPLIPSSQQQSTIAASPLPLYSASWNASEAPLSQAGGTKSASSSSASFSPEVISVSESQTPATVAPGAAHQSHAGVSALERLQDDDSGLGSHLPQTNGEVDLTQFDEANDTPGSNVQGIVYVAEEGEEKEQVVSALYPQLPPLAADRFGDELIEAADGETIIVDDGGVLMANSSEVAGGDLLVSPTAAHEFFPGLAEATQEPVALLNGAVAMEVDSLTTTQGPDSSKEVVRTPTPADVSLLDEEHGHAIEQIVEQPHATEQIEVARSPLVGVAEAEHVRPDIQSQGGDRQSFGAGSSIRDTFMHKHSNGNGNGRPQGSARTSEVDQSAKRLHDELPPSEQAADIIGQLGRRTSSTTTGRPERKSRSSIIPDAVRAWFSPKKSTKQREDTTDHLSPALPVLSEASDPLAIASLPTSFETNKEVHQAGPTAVATGGVTTTNAYYAPLAATRALVNSANWGSGTGAVDVFGVVSQGSKEPVRARGGPKDYFTILQMADMSLPADNSVRVEVYRPWVATLPVAQVGDIILLRNFVVRSRKHLPYLLSTDASSWCVWRFSGQTADKQPDAATAWAHGSFTVVDAGAREEIKGPSVDLGQEERLHALTLRRWWQDVRSSQPAQEQDGTATEALDLEGVSAQS